MNTLLMSRDNPEGMKLEELLAQVRSELVTKTALLEGDDCPVSKDIQDSNRAIINLLLEAEAIQRNTMERLRIVGEDNGPYAEPRVGK